MDVTSLALAEQPHQNLDIERRDLGHRCDALCVQLAGGDGPNTPQTLDRQRMQELELAARLYRQEAIGLADAACNLGQELGVGDANRDCQPHFVAHPLPKPSSDLDR